ncbi:bifunctional nuclease family protein [Chloroflexi bacterium TSY]|nr:bifunctional nuclease family protein [Chloroflexi bacterium TSY]
MEKRTDDELIRSICQGNRDSFDPLAERYFPMLRRVAFRMIANREIAQDIAQEAMLQAYLSLRNLHNTERFESWLYGIVRNVCHNYLRSRQAQDDLWDELADSDNRMDEFLLRHNEMNLQQLIEDRELYGAVQEAMNALSPKNREAALLFYNEELSIREIAATLGASVNAIKGRLYQSRKQLQEQIKPIYEAEDQSTSRVTTSRLTPMKSSIQSIKRNKTMVKITDVRTIQIEGVDKYAMLYLLDKENSRTLPIATSPTHAREIERQVDGKPTRRDATFQFMWGMLDVLGGNLEEVRIEAMMKYHIFYAVATVQKDGDAYEVDTHPFEAISMALHAERPIFVTDDVMQHAGEELPQPFDEKAWLANQAERLALMYNEATHVLDDTILTQHARQVWTQASNEALQLNHSYVGTEHLLVSLLRDTDGLAGKVLNELGAKLERITSVLDQLVGHGDAKPTSDPVLAPRVVEVFDLASASQKEMGHAHLGTEHLLLGIVQEGKGCAINLLRKVGVEPENIEARILEIIQPK